MRILVLGNINSKWVKEYVERVLLPLGHEVEVLGTEKGCKYLDFYRSNGVTVRAEKKAKGLSARIPFVRVLNSASRTVKANDWSDYDLIVNMFVNHRNLRITRKIRSEKTKTVVYYTGSDLLRKGKLSLLINRIMLKRPDAYVVGSDALKEAFAKKYPAGTPAEVIRFGVSAFDSIKKIRSERPGFERKNVFCIGYSGVKEHNHIAVLDVFDRLTPERKEKIELVVPMTYMATKEYLSEVKAKLESTGIRYRQLTEFMDNDAMAEMWSGVGYFINAQTTDSLSASVLEAVYSGAVLFNAAWLEYPEYKEFNVKYLPFSDYGQLYDLIVKAVDGDIPDDAVNDPGTLDGAFSWSAAKENWARLLDRL